MNYPFEASRKFWLLSILLGCLVADGCAYPFRYAPGRPYGWQGPGGPGPHGPMPGRYGRPGGPGFVPAGPGPVMGLHPPGGPTPVPDFTANAHVPRELDKVTLPVYRAEPPDILLIETVNNIRPAADKLRAGDELLVRAATGVAIDPQGDPVTNEFKYINGNYLVQSTGEIDLGPEYGQVKVAGLTLQEATQAVLKYLKDVKGIKTPQVAISLPNVAGKQQIAGEHLVRPDGTVTLGVYGNVHVAGMTLDEIKRAVEQQLRIYIHEPEVRVDVIAYNSKAFYVITDGGGNGERVVKLPCTGNETVLDAIAQIEGLSEVSSKKMWIARPAPPGATHSQVLPVDWEALAAGGLTATNYQVLPGDRIYIQADDLVALDNWVAKLTSPFERVFGFILLGNGTAKALEGGGRNSGGGGGSNF